MHVFLVVILTFMDIKFAIGEHANGTLNNYFKVHVVHIVPG
jgi:hypothetical protein